VTEHAAAWAAVPWATPLAGVVGVHPALRLAGRGLRTAGDLDALVMGCREAELRQACGLKLREANEALARLHEWSLRQFLAALAGLRGAG
jgi:hypothetical protein